MPRIRFTADPKLPADLAHLAYRRGVEVDISDDQANRWIRRGVAVIVPPAEPLILAADTGPLAVDTMTGDSAAADSLPADPVAPTGHAGDVDSLDGADTMPSGRGRRGRASA